MKTLLLNSLAAAALAVGGIHSAVGVSGQEPGNQALSLLEVVERLEAAGYAPLTEISMDDGAWEVETRKEGESVELTVDLVSGKVLAEHRDDPETVPPADAMRLSKLLRIVLKDGTYKNLDEVSFERRYWEIEVYKDRQKRELYVDPMTANIVSDRVDD
ncbi:MAG: PepSY domain-containing protein [Pirellulaceae bacterium]